MAARLASAPGVERLEGRRLMAAAYNIIDLGTLGGTTSYAYDLNASNQVVGYARTATGQEHAFRFADANGNRVADPGEMVDLGVLSGHTASYAYGINDAGQIVGTSRTAPLSQEQATERAVRFNPGTTPTDLGLGDGSNAREINEAGQVVGGATVSGQYRAFLRSAGGSVSTFVLPDPYNQYSEAQSLNEAGVVVGFSGSNAGDSGFIRTAGGTMTPVGFASPDGLRYNYVWDVNASGQAVGEGFNPNGDYRAFRYANGTVTDLGTLSGFGNTQAFGINDAGTIVGRLESTSGSTGPTRAFIYQNGVMRDLNTLIPANSGWTLSEAREVNETGSIVGWGVSPSGATHAFLLVPAPTGAPPRVQQVYVRGSNWTSGYLSSLANDGTGSATHGFRVQGGAEQHNELPWANLNQVRIQFTEGVSIQTADVTVTTTSGSPLTVTGVAYDAATFTATATLSRALANEKITVRVDGDGPSGVVDTDGDNADGNYLDGEWANPAGNPPAGGRSYPSGNGTAGGDFVFSMRVLPGDFTRDGAVNLADFGRLRSNFNQPNRSVLHGDANGDGLVNLADFGALRAGFGKTAPF